MSEDLIQTESSLGETIWISFGKITCVTAHNPGGERDLVKVNFGVSYVILTLKTWNDVLQVYKDMCFWEDMYV